MLPSCTPFITTFIARRHTGALQRCAWLCIDVCSQGFEVDWFSVCMCNICACFSAKVHSICRFNCFRMNHSVFMVVFFICQKNLEVYVDVNIILSIFFWILNGIFSLQFRNVGLTFSHNFPYGQILWVLAKLIWQYIVMISVAILIDLKMLTTRYLIIYERS